MELWIRTQDRKYLIQTKYLYIAEDKDNDCCYVGDKNVGHIGTYKTKERALEVLDEIQKLLMPKFSVDLGSIKYEQTDQPSNVLNATCNCEVLQLNTYVYEMPKE